MKTRKKRGGCFIRGLAAACMIMSICPFPGCAGGEELLIPPGLTTIEASAFEGNGSIQSIILPDGMIVIEERAFANCINLRKIQIPSSIQEIGNEAFNGITGPVLVMTEPGCYAMQWAASNGMDYRAETKFRALLIANSEYTETFAEKLPGAKNDVAAIKALLSSWHGMPYSITTKEDLTGDEMLSLIRSTFRENRKQDISLLYFSGHGRLISSANRTGALAGVDGKLITASTLKKCLDEIPGRKIVIVDACYSGILIGNRPLAAPSGQLSANFASAFLLPFTGKRLPLQAPGADAESVTLADNGYYLIVSAAADEESYEYQSMINDGQKEYGIFTRELCLACGYDMLKESYVEVSADQNKDHVVTLKEAFEETRKKVGTFVSSYGGVQNVQAWPVDCDWFGFLRKE